jgi:hypothetical protein
MRLLHTTDFKVREFMESGPNCVKYAILSHTWAAEEVTFQDMLGEPLPVHKVGVSKLQNSCI